MNETSETVRLAMPRRCPVVLQGGRQCVTRYDDARLMMKHLSRQHGFTVKQLHDLSTDLLRQSQDNTPVLEEEVQGDECDDHDLE